MCDPMDAWHTVGLALSLDLGLGLGVGRKAKLGASLDLHIGMMTWPMCGAKMLLVA